MSDTASFDPVVTARLILRQARTGALATLRADGGPFASLVTVATDDVGAPILLLSGLALHTVNLVADARASLLLEGTTIGDPLQGGRISLVGRINRVQRGDDCAVRRRFLARQPEAGLYAGFKDFDFWLMRVDSAHLVAGFGRIVTIAAADLLLDAALAKPVADEEERLVSQLRLSDDVPAALLAADGGGWRVVGLDADGLDLGREKDGDWALRRVPFQRPLRSSTELPARLKEIAAKPIEH